MRRLLVTTARRLAAACLATADSVKGPFYRAGAPSRDRLCPEDQPGEPLTVSGRVTSAGTCVLRFHHMSSSADTQFRPQPRSRFKPPV